MTHPMLQLPYAIWSSIPATGLQWVENLSPTDKADLPEYRVKVSRVLKGSTPTHELLFCHDGEQYQLVEASNRLPHYISNSFSWRLNENAMKTLLQKLVDEHQSSANSGV